MFCADLHLHSVYSDGSETRRELLEMARKRGLTHLAFTDHDTTRDAEAAAALGMEYGIRVAAGVEISTLDAQTGKKAHILGYAYRSAGAIEAVCRSTREQRTGNLISSKAI